MQLLTKTVVVVYVISETESKDNKKQRMRREHKLSETIHRNHSVDDIIILRN